MTLSNHTAHEVLEALQSDELWPVVVAVVDASPNKDAAARALLRILPAKTPGGASYTKTSVRWALRYI